MDKRMDGKMAEGGNEKKDGMAKRTKKGNWEGSKEVA